MQLIDFDLETELAPSWRAKRRLEKLRPAGEPHPLRAFFRERAITWAKIGKILGVTESCISYWMRGAYPPPPMRERELWALRDGILEWEGKNGRKFGY